MCFQAGRLAHSRLSHGINEVSGYANQSWTDSAMCQGWTLQCLEAEPGAPGLRAAASNRFSGENLSLLQGLPVPLCIPLTVGGCHRETEFYNKVLSLAHSPKLLKKI